MSQIEHTYCRIVVHIFCSTTNMTRRVTSCFWELCKEYNTSHKPQIQETAPQNWCAYIKTFHNTLMLRPTTRSVYDRVAVQALLTSLNKIPSVQDLSRAEVAVYVHAVTERRGGGQRNKARHSIVTARANRAGGQLERDVVRAGGGGGLHIIIRPSRGTR